MSIAQSGSRHLRKDPSGKLGALRPTHRSVLIRVHGEYAKSIACQHLLQMVVQLLSRQFGVVDLLILDVPPTAVHFDCFPLNGSEDLKELQQQLLHLGELVGGKEVAIQLYCDAAPEADIQLSIGRVDLLRQNLQNVSVFGDGWRFFCSDTHPSPELDSFGEVSIGPYMAACFAAAAIFKFMHGMKCQTDVSGDLFSSTETWAEVGGPRCPFQFPDALMIGAGAVGAATAMTLATSRATGNLVVLDPQDMDETNRNRLVSGAFLDTDTPKAELITRFSKRYPINIFPYVGRWPDYSIDADRIIPDILRQRESQDRYEWILSCVDHNLDRRNIAKFLPRHVLGGSTEGLAAQVSYYSYRGERECLACHHPIPKRSSTEEVYAALRALNREERFRWYTRYEVAPDLRSEIEATIDRPACGTLAAAEMERIGRDGEPAWSVGFVSVAAGVLQAAQFVRASALGPDLAFREITEFYAWFLGSSIGSSRAQRNLDCNICSSAMNRERYDRLWADMSNGGV